MTKISAATIRRLQRSVKKLKDEKRARGVTARERWFKIQSLERIIRELREERNKLFNELVRLRARVES